MNKIGEHFLCLAALKAHVLTARGENIKVAEALHTQQRVGFGNYREAQVVPIVNDAHYRPDLAVNHHRQKVVPANIQH